MTQTAQKSLLPPEVESVRNLGIPILPLWGVDEHGICKCPKSGSCPNAGKHPAGFLVRNGVKDATTDLEILNSHVKRGGNRIQFGAAAGCRMNDGRFLEIVDRDDRNGGDKSLSELPALPPTATARTGSGGAHYFLATKEPVQCRILAPGLDLKGEGGFVVIAPARNKNGSYEWEALYSIEDTMIADSPDWMRADAPQDAKPRPPTDGASARDSLLGEAFAQAGMLGVELPRGVIAVRCPWAHEHSDARGRGDDSSTAILPPTTDSNFGGFRCQHEHCRARGWADVLNILDPSAVRQARVKFGPKPVEQGDIAAIDYSKPPVEIKPALVTGGLTPDQLAIVRDNLAYTKPDSTGRTKLRADMINAVALLKYDPRWSNIIRYNSFSREIIAFREPPWHPDDMPAGVEKRYPSPLVNSDTARVALWFQRYWDMSLPTEKIQEAIMVYAEAQGFHPVRDYLRSLKWDGVKRIDTWMKEYLGSVDNDAYTSAVGRWWLISAVARVMHPGEKVDTCLILEGKQGIGKSTALKILASEPWFSDTPLDLGNKDAMIALSGKWIIEFAELDSLNRTDSNRAKSFMTSATDRFREPYARATCDVPRQCVFAGTVNHSQYLRDETGNRRYWPVKCAEVNTDALALVRDQLWAEAFAAFQAGDKWFPKTEAEHALCAVEQAKRELGDEWDHVLSEWLRTPTAKTMFETRGWVTAGDVLQKAMGVEPGRWSHADTVRIGRSLQRSSLLTKVRATEPDTNKRLWAYKLRMGATLATEDDAHG